MSGPVGRRTIKPRDREQAEAGMRRGQIGRIRTEKAPQRVRYLKKRARIAGKPGSRKRFDQNQAVLSESLSGIKSVLEE